MGLTLENTTVREQFFSNEESRGWTVCLEEWFVDAEFLIQILKYHILYFSSYVLYAMRKMCE